MQNILGRAMVAVALATLVGCSAGGGDGNGGGGDTGNGNRDGGTTGLDGASNTDGGHVGRDVQYAMPDSQINWDAYFANDPPPQVCYDDGGRAYVDAGNIMGTDPNCPPDKNREGCPCTTSGMTAPCWPGPRANRNRGSCHDGMTTCSDAAEFPTWGPCMGYVLPTPGATRGPGACNCFSMGMWNLADTSPCFAFSDQAQTMVAGAFSSAISGTSVTCGPALSGSPPYPPPAATWTTSTLSVDCGGRFQLCFNLRAFGTPAAATSMTVADSDCTMSTSCVQVDVPMGTGTQTVTPPPLPSWTTSTNAQLACAQQFITNGGYGEMTVLGLTSDCQDFNNGAGQPLVFNRVNYCPSACNGPSPPAMCAMCTNGASGGF